MSLKTLFVAVVAATIAVVGVSTLAASDKQMSRLLTTAPKSFQDPAIVRLVPQIGLPFDGADFGRWDDKQVGAFMNKEFPRFVAVAAAVASTGAASNETQSLGYRRALKAELIRLAIFVNALQIRNADGDEAMLKKMSAVAMPSLKSDQSFACHMCKIIVGMLKSKLADVACDAAGEAIFGTICAAVLDPLAVPLCVAALNWGCGKLLEYIEDGLPSGTICRTVFGRWIPNCQ